MRKWLVIDVNGSAEAGRLLCGPSGMKAGVGGFSSFVSREPADVGDRVEMFKLPATGEIPPLESASMGLISSFAEGWKSKLACGLVFNLRDESCTVGMLGVSSCLRDSPPEMVTVGLLSSFPGTSVTA